MKTLNTIAHQLERIADALERLCGPSTPVPKNDRQTKQAESFSARDKAWTKEEDETLANLYKARLTDYEIAYRMGRTFYAVRTRRQVLGINKKTYSR